CPRDDVDFFALQLAHNGLNAGAAHTHTGTDRVDGAVTGNDRDLRAGAGVTGNSLDLDHAGISLGHFLLEQLGKEAGTCAAEENLRAALFAADLKDVSAYTLAGFKMFARQGILTAHIAFATAKVDGDVAVFHAFDHAGYDFASAVLVFFKHTLALGIAYFL